MGSYLPLNQTDGSLHGAAGFGPLISKQNARARRECRRTHLHVLMHWGTDDWPPFAHYEEIGYMMPMKAPSEGLAAF